MEQIATFLQVDLQSLFGRGRRKKMDFEKIWENFNDRETEFLTEAFIYSIKSPDFNSSNFETKLKAIGYNLQVKSLPDQNKFKNYRSNTRISHAIPITCDCISRLDRFDKWIFMSNNGEFVDLCKFLKNAGKKIEIWSFLDNYDPALEPYADKMHFIDNSFCMDDQPPNFSVFGANWGLEKMGAIFDSTSRAKDY